MKELCGDNNPLTLHLDPHQDILNYNDIQIIAYLCHSCEVPLSLSIGGCEANRDLQELASLSASVIQASCIESSFALSKLLLSYNRIYNTLEVSKKPSITLSLNTPGCFACLGEILSSSDSSPIRTLLIDRNALSLYSLDDASIMSRLETSIQGNQTTQRIKIGICGGISPANVDNLREVYKPDFICTKMFMANVSGVSEQTTSSSIISALLVLEARILELILLHRRAISSVIIGRKESLVSYIQASTINQILKEGE